MRAIPRSMCKDVMKNFIKRMQMCVDNNGGHVEQCLFSFRTVLELLNKNFANKFVSFE